MTEKNSCTVPVMFVRELLSKDALELKLTMLAGEEFIKNPVRSSAVQKPGLALAGFAESIHASSIQLLEKSDTTFLEKMSSFERMAILQEVCKRKVACFICAEEIEIPQELFDAAREHCIPILRTTLKSTFFMERANIFLDERLSPRTTVHGVLLDIYGLGVLILGESGVGKSECALDLIVRGHRLVSDDAIEIRRKGEFLVGRGPEMTRYHMELRGLGIINIKDLFGITSVRDEKNVEYVVGLDRWMEEKEYDRLGLEESSYEILGIDLPCSEMPVAPGRNLSVLIEVAARNQLLKTRGDYSARKLAGKLHEKLKNAASSVKEKDE